MDSTEQVSFTLSPEDGNIWFMKLPVSLERQTMGKFQKSVIWREERNL
jgi:hypothetical protein